MFIFTFCESYVVAYCCAAVRDPKLVLSAAFMTAGIVVALTLYAMTTKRDFTVMGGMMFVIGAAFIMFGLFGFLFGPTVRLIYCLIGVVLFGAYLVFDTQLILGGKRYAMDKDDYIFGAVILYLDIINIFLYLLQILAALGGDSR
jgi:FtsH-binding integral membrane protein